MQLFPEIAKYELTHPVLKDESGKALPTGLVLHVLPVDHDDFFKASFGILKSLSKKTEDVAESLEARIQIVAAAVVDWEVKEEHKGDWVKIFEQYALGDLTFTKDKLIKLLSLPVAGWIRKQIDAVIQDAERFFGKASNS